MLKLMLMRSSSLSLLVRKAAELDQTSFLLVQLQTEFGKACSEHFQACRCLLAMLEAHHKVIRIADEESLPMQAWLHLVFEPKVQHVVQEHV